MPPLPFVEYLKKPEAQKLTDRLKIFIQNCYAEPEAIAVQRRRTVSFLELMLKESIKNPAFATLVSTEDGVTVIREGWEKITMTKLHDLYFGAKRTDGIRVILDDF
jgi:hypothetical protein